MVMPQMALSPSEVSFFRSEGFLIVRGVFSAEEMRAAGSEADALLQRTDLQLQNNLRVRFATVPPSNQTIFDIYDPVFDLSPLLARFGEDARIRDRLSSLYGEPACPFKDKLIYK